MRSRRKDARHEDGSVARRVCGRRWERLRDRGRSNDRVDRLEPERSPSPVGKESNGQPNGALGVGVESPVEGGPQLGNLPIEASQPPKHVGAKERALGLEGEVQKKREVRGAQAVCFAAL